MKKIKVKSKDIKSFEIEVKDLTMDERILVTECIHKINLEPARIFALSVEICVIGTGLNKEDLNEYSRSQLYALAKDIYDLAEKRNVRLCLWP